MKLDTFSTDHKAELRFLFQLALRGAAFHTMVLLKVCYSIDHFKYFTTISGAESLLCTSQYEL